MTSEHLFVYGTLLADVEHPVGALLRVHAELIGAGTIQARLYDLGAYPGAILSESPEEFVHGEVYQVRQWETVIRRIDVYEGCSDKDAERQEFQRREVLVNRLDGAGMMAWSYLYIGEYPAGGYMQGGDYGAYLSKLPITGGFTKLR